MPLTGFTLCHTGLTHYFEFLTLGRSGAQDMTSVTLNPSNSSNLEQLALKGLIVDWINSVVTGRLHMIGQLT